MSKAGLKLRGIWRLGIWIPAQRKNEPVVVVRGVSRGRGCRALGDSSYNENRHKPNRNGSH